MCRPTHYQIVYEINPWMSVKQQANRPRALAQWQRLYDVLTQHLRARVKLLPPKAGVPDLVFTANAGLMAHPHATNGGVGLTTPLLIRSNFRHPEREQEEPLIERYFRRARIRVVQLPARYDFEGEGDALWVQQTLVFGFRFRSDAPVHTHLARLLRRRVLPVELVDRRFYHLDTCFCPLDQHRALWYPNAFDRYGQRVIKHLVPELIAVSETDALTFVCNAIPIGRALVLQSGFSSSLKRRLTHAGFRLYPVDLSEFLKAGGSAKCLVLRL